MLGGLLPRRLLAGGPEGSRQFLFLFCRGGWDPAWVFTPELLGAPDVFTDPSGSWGEGGGGLPFVDSPARPRMRALMQDWGAQACLVQGIEVRSITHEACRRIMFTGGTSAADDWAARIAGPVAEDWALPSLVISGPSYTSAYTSAVMRVGEDGQLGKLLDGSALREADQAIDALPPSAEALVEAFVQARLDAAGEGGRGREAAFLAAQRRARVQAEVLGSVGALDLSVGQDGSYVYVHERARPALDALERGLCRCALVEHSGQWDVGWDTHSGAEDQGAHFEVLADDLLSILGELEDRGLLERVTVVVFSEMGRAPQLNVTGGKDHWTFTSALLLGAGVRGGQVVGGYDAQLLGQPVDLASGLPDAGGESLTAAHLGATLLALAGQESPDAPPIAAVLG